MKRSQTYQLTIIDRDLACAPSKPLQQSCARMIRAVASSCVLLVSTFETEHDIRHNSTDADRRATDLMDRAAVGAFHVRSATDDCNRRTDNPVDWVEECVARFIEEYIGISRREWPEYAKKKQKRFDIMCMASSAIWRDAVARICVRSCYFVRSFLILAPIYNKNNTMEPTKATLAAKLVAALMAAPGALAIADQQPFVCKRIISNPGAAPAHRNDTRP
jgi:hypothetical protein